MISNETLSINKKSSKKKSALQIIFGNRLLEVISQTKVLIVGAGGIGCEIIKNLSKFKVKKITVIDLDIIQETNLNRQFYFTYSDVGKSKSQVLKQKIMKINPTLSIQTYQDSIYDSKFNYSFYSQFDVVFSALDNMKARQFLAKNVTKYSKYLIDAGTSGYNGQCYSSVRYLTSCHNCYRQNVQQEYAICSIRSRPQKNIHCAVYAKALFEILFQQKTQTKYIQTNYISNIIKVLRQLPKEADYSTFQSQIIKMFNYLFSDNIKTEDMNGNPITFCKKLTYQEAIKIQNEPSKFLKSQNIFINVIQNFGKILSLCGYARGFTQLVYKLIKRKNQNKLSQKFDKDDDQCCALVGCITNLRIYNFKNSNNSNNKLKFLTFFQCKQLIGKIIPAIASTNSIAASLQINEFIKIVSQNFNKCRYTTINYFSQAKIQSHFLSLPNKDCQVCSKKNLYYQIECNFQQTTFQQFQQYAYQHCNSQKRSVFCKSMIIIKNGDNVKKISPNKEKKINFKPDLLVHNTITLNFFAEKTSDLNVQVILINNQSVNEKFRMIEALNKKLILNSQKSQQSKTKEIQDKKSQKFEQIQ